MTSRHFGDFVANFNNYAERLAMTMRPFLKLERVDYGQLQRRTYQTANYLLAQDVQLGDRIMVVANNSPDWVQLFLGSQLIGAILVPVDVTSSPATTLKFIEQTQPKLILRNRHFHPELDQASRVDWLDDLSEHSAAFSETAPDIDLAGDCSSLIVFTSGTTADPKGVVLTQKNVLANVGAALRVIPVGPDWRFLSVLPLSHMYELTGGMLAPLSSGASIVYVPSVSPRAIASALQEYHITTILAVPQLLVLMLEQITQGAAAEGKATTFATALKLAAVLPVPLRRLLFRDVHSRLGNKLDLVITGGAPIPIEVGLAWERLGVRTVQGYGLTETAPILTMNPLHGRRLDTAGRALDNVHLRIAEDNEIQAEGPSVFHEYWRNPIASAQAFTDDGWFKTGDAGHLQSGWLYIQGRLKFVIVLSNGLKVFPEDVELVADKYPIFRAICIVGVKRPSGEEVVAVVISGHSDDEISKAIDGVNAHVESFQHVTAWRRWPEENFPFTRLLKIDRRKVQDWANETSQEVQSIGHEETPGEDAIADLIRQSLGEPRREINDFDRLADIGLDSLRRLTVVALIEDQLGIAIQEGDITQTTTVAGLRELVTAGNPAERPIPRPSWPFRRWVRLLGDVTRDVVIHAIIRIWVTLSVQGQDKLDGLDAPALYIFNHSDDFDGPVVYQALPRRIRQRLTVAAADDVMRMHKVLAFVIRFCFAGFNLARTDPYMPSLEYVGTLVDQGWNVLLAPEGRLSTNGILQPFKSGIGLLAVNLGVPVVPMKIFGLFGTVPLHAKWPKRRGVVTVRIGQPMRFDSHMDYDDVVLKLHQVMEDL
ncbi:MAG: AMP-binding protein [Acidimicrobiales bacterium]